MSANRTQEIAKDIYWVGGSNQNGGLNCNPYLIVDEDEAVLLDPGSVLDFEEVFQNVCSIVPIDKIKYVILHHQDPDFCSSVPLFEKKGAHFKVVTHWRTETIVKFYGIKSDYYIVNENEFKLVLKSGRMLGFVQTPYLHFPGAIATYDYNTKILFSSDLFGAISHEWQLYAGYDYIEKMKTFHEHYMPSNDILRPVMELLLTMDISIIAPQHGSIIKSKIKEHIIALRDLECGVFIIPVKKDIVKAGGYRFICSTVLKRYASIFNKKEVLEAIEGIDIVLEEGSMEISDYSYRGNNLWDLIFERILATKGIHWLIVIEPLVQRLSKEYDIPFPKVFETTLVKARKDLDCINRENIMLKEINTRLERSIRETQERLTKCPVTGLYNYDFFNNYLKDNIKYLIEQDSQLNPTLIIISADNISKIKFLYGDEEIDGILKNIAYIINDLRDENTVVFRLQGASFAYYVPHITKEKAVVQAESFRNAISNSEKFIERVTVSIGVLCFDEIRSISPHEKEPSKVMYNAAIMRVKLAKNMGMNIVCSDSSIEDYQEEIGKILLIDNDEILIDVLRTFLENLKYKVLTAMDGEEALCICEKEVPNLIISAIMIPKMDGFMVRQKLLLQSQTKNIPFIIVSHLKNDDSVEHAAALGIEHYFKKPYMLSELLGVIRNKIKGDAYQ